MKIQTAAVYTYERIIASLEAYRLFNPMTSANLQINKGVIDGVFSTDAISKSDIVVFQREFPNNLSNYLSVMSQAANLGKPVVMDMDDDLLSLPIHHPDRVKLNYAKAQIPILTGMVQATALTVTTPYLADQLRKYNSNIFVMPNYLDDSLWHFNAPQVEPVGDKIRIFFMGTVTHVPDLEMLKPAFRALAMKYPGRLEYMFYGANLKFEESIPATVTNCQSETFVYADYVRVALAQKANIAIAPLENIPYNHCKSSIKYFEYSATGLPGVYSRVTPYSSVIEEGINGFTAATVDEWIDKLSQLIENSQLREAMALAAQETVKRDWLLSDHAHLWPDTYAQIAELKTPNQANIASYLPTLEDINIHLDTFFKKQDQKISELSWHLSLRDQKLSEKSEEVSGLVYRIESIGQTNAELRAQVDDLRVQWIDHTRQIQAIESENRFLNQAWHESKLEVVNYALSRSWRITRPMRKIIKAIRGK
ncbi:MAG TPA: hypothetical protein DD636_06680 [Anaerolineaceae bacterium]|jgi:glycosyltransferase involved in cell wall biosynthesis|nr:hypothetical protein [Anaerolineaceae bacterium]